MEMNMRLKIMTVFLLMVIGYTKCHINNEYIRNIINRLKNRYEMLYGKPQEGVELWNTETARRLQYPRGDTKKLADIAHIWWSYYECSYLLTTKLTSARRLPSSILMVHQGGTARLTCNLCVAPDDHSALEWRYAETTNNLTFHSIRENSRLVLEEDGSVTIYHVERTDVGVYRCQIGHSFGGLVILQVIDCEENYTVKVKGEQYSFSSETNLLELSADTRELFEAFPEGIPCRSQHLPTVIRNIPAVKERRSEIIIETCKVTCADAAPSKIIQDGGIRLPWPARNIMYAVSGQPITIQCPGTTLRDIPVLWRVGTKYVVPRDLDKFSGGRVCLNSMDYLKFTVVQYADTNLYSCWQAGNLAGTVKLVVWNGNSYWNHHTTLVALVVVAGVVLHVTGRVLRNMQRRMGGL